MPIPILLPFFTMTLNYDQWLTILTSLIFQSKQFSKLNFKDIVKSKPFTARFKKSSALLDKDVTCTFTNLLGKEMSSFRNFVPMCYWKVLAIDIGINQIPTLNKSIGNTDTNAHFQEVLQYSGNTEKSLPILAIPIQYCNINNPEPEWSNNVTCHPTQGNAPHHNPIQPGQYLIYLPQRDGRLSWPR